MSDCCTSGYGTMCLTNRITTNLPESIEAFKVFATDDAGSLRSPFIFHYCNGENLEYVCGLKLKVSPPDAVFYAFLHKHDAESFKREAENTVARVPRYTHEEPVWLVVDPPFVIHRVIMTKLVAFGDFEQLNEQSCWEAVEAQEIVVHPN